MCTYSSITEGLLTRVGSMFRHGVLQKIRGRYNLWLHLQCACTCSLGSWLCGHVHEVVEGNSTDAGYMRASGQRHLLSVMPSSAVEVENETGRMRNHAFLGSPASLFRDDWSLKPEIAICRPFAVSCSALWTSRKSREQRGRLAGSKYTEDDSFRRIVQSLSSRPDACRLTKRSNHEI